MKSKKLKILMINLPFSGHINPTLGLSSALVTGGHDVAYLLDENWREVVEQTGANFISYDNYSSDWSDTKKNVLVSSRAYSTALRIGANYDCIIYETIALFGKNLGDILNKPSIRLMSTFALNYEIVDKLVKTGGFNFTGLSKLGAVYKLLCKRSQKKGFIRKADYIAEIVENAPDLNIVYTSKEFQIDAESFADKKYRFVGASIHARHDVKEDMIDFSNIKQKIIYISLGTLLHGSLSFYRKCIKAFAKMDVKVILSIGRKTKISELGRIPSNFLVFGFVPQLEVLKHADLFVTHGGMNSVNEALYFGVPMLVIPYTNDQPTVADRLVELGLGYRLNQKQLSGESLQATAKKLLLDKSSKNKIMKIGEQMQLLGGNDLAAKYIVDYMKNC